MRVLDHRSADFVGKSLASSSTFLELYNFNFILLVVYAFTEEEKILDVFGIADHVGAENPLSITKRSAHICAEQLPPGERLSSLQSGERKTVLFVGVFNDCKLKQEVSFISFIALEYA